MCQNLPGPCQPTVDHVFKLCASRARCIHCGAVSEIIPWDATYPPKDITARCLESFREEVHYAD
jgi:hypothetical protein